MRARVNRHTLAAVVAGLLVVGAAGPVGAAAAKPSAKPTVHHLSVAAGPTKGGTKITITGTGFRKVKKVTFGAAPGKDLTVSSAKKLKVVAPKHAAGTVKVVVVTKSGKSAATKHTRFTYVAPPAVTHVAPASGPAAGGTVVTVSGHNFSHVTKVTFGTTAGTSVKVASTTKLTVTSPKHAAGIADLRVKTAYGTSAVAAADHYRFQAAATPLSWTNTTVPPPLGSSTDSQTTLSIVSCGAVGSCVAIGYIHTGNGIYISTLSQGAWTDASPPAPADILSGHSSGPADVSCTSATHCVMVGRYLKSLTDVEGFIATYDGTAWTAIDAPLPGDAAANPAVTLSKLSCGSGTSCVAVGHYASSAGQHALIETIAAGTSASTATGIAAPLPGDAAASPNATLVSVDCPAAGSCAAIGTYVRTNGYTEVLAESLASGAWTEASPNTTGDTDANPNSDLLSIACSAPGECAAIGESGGGGVDGVAVVLHNGGWTVVAAPGTEGPATTYEQADCLSGGACVGVGSDGNEDNGGLANVIGSGSVGPPLPGDATHGGSKIASYNAISCASTFCVLGGHYWNAAPHPQALFEQYDGSGFTPTVAPEPATAIAGDIYSVSCAGPTFCVAVGVAPTSDTGGVPIADIGTA